MASSLLAAILIARGASAMPGIKIVSSNSSAVRGETVLYVENDRQRVEERRKILQSLRPGGPVVYVSAPPIVTITRCDLNQIFTLNLDAREYVSRPMPKPPSPQELEARRAAQERALAAQKPTLLIETTTQDTGERRNILGYMARHVIITVKQIPQGESNQIPQENVTDGWYIDLDASAGCAKTAVGAFLVSGGAPRKLGEPYQPPVIRFSTVGKRETGFAVEKRELHRATLTLPDGSKQTREDVTNEMKVTSLSMTQLDPALFEIPKNFRQVEQIGRRPVLSNWMRLSAWLEYYWLRLKSAI